MRDQPFLDARERVIDERIGAGHLEGNVGDHRAARGHRYGLKIGNGGMRAVVLPDLVEDLADHLEGRALVRASDTEVDPHRLADLCFERVLVGQLADLPLKTKCVGISLTSAS
jgi:hypothetical protein